MQLMSSYRDQTTFIITADHGRVGGLTAWNDHGTEQKRSENIWIGVFGRDTQPLGEREHTPAVTQSQIAATMARSQEKTIETPCHKPLKRRPM